MVKPSENDATNGGIFHIHVHVSFAQGTKSFQWRSIEFSTDHQ